MTLQNINDIDLGTEVLNGSDGDTTREAFSKLIAQFQPQVSLDSFSLFANQIALINLGLLDPATPTISSTNVTQGYICGDTPVQINGLGLSTVTSVFFGGVRAKFWFAPNDTTIWCIPFPVSTAQTVTVTVTVAGGATATFSYNFISRTVGSTQTKHTLTTGDTGARLACLGNDLNIWWAAAYGAAYSFTPDGAKQVYPLNETLPDYIFDICAGPGGKLWCTGSTTGSIYKVFTDPNFAAQVTQLPGSGSNQSPLIYEVLNICTGPDARLWCNSPGEFDTLMYAVDDANNVTTYKVSDWLLICPITNPNGNLWCASIKVADGLQYLVELNTNGQIVGTPQQIVGVIGTIQSMRIGIDGNVWAADNTGILGTNAFLKIPPNNPAATARYVANQIHSATAVAIDGQGNVWMSDGTESPTTSVAAKCTITGTVTQYVITGSGAGSSSDNQSVATDVKGLPNYAYYLGTGNSTPAFVTVFS